MSDLSTKQIQMYALQELHMDSWSGNELGNVIYFAIKAQADAYAAEYHRQFYNKDHTPEYYKTYTTKGLVWVEEALLTLKEDSCGMYCILKLKEK